MSKKIDYDQLIRKASLSVVKDILNQIAVDGLFKKQHIYVTFSLEHPSVKVSKLIRDDFDDEMTIVLQYEFWDLNIDDYGFSVSLAFENSDETLYIPYSAISSVSDPSEDFCLDFIPDFSDIKKEKNSVKNEDVSGKVISIDAFRKGK